MELIALSLVGSILLLTGHSLVLLAKRLNSPKV